MMNSQFMNVVDTSFKDRGDGDTYVNSLDILPDLFGKQPISFVDSTCSIGNEYKDKESVRSGKESFRNESGKESHRNTMDIND